MNTKLLLIFLSVFLLQCKSNRVRESDRSAISLENTHWRLVEVNGEPVVTPVNGREVYMVLSREGDVRRLSGHAGCNGLGGDYELNGNTISFQVITTRMYCELQMKTENQFTQMLSAADRYDLHGTRLELYDGNVLLGKFEAAESSRSE